MAWPLGRIMLMALLAWLSITAARPALADWDPRRYLEIVSGAEHEFSDARFAEAIELYAQARTMLQTALDAGELEPDDVPGAQRELARLRYQIARATQLAGNCPAAWNDFLDHLERGDLVAEVADLVPVRAVQSGACAVDLSLDVRDIATAERLLDEIERLDAEHQTGVDDVTLLRELEEARAELPLLRIRLHDTALALALEASLDDRCEAAAVALATAERHPPAERTPLESARQAVHARCEPDTSAAPPSMGLDQADTLGVSDVLPWVIVAGGLGLVGWGVAEELRFGEDADAFEAARDRCLALQGDGSQCLESMRLGDELEARRALPVGLIAGGAVVAAGGLTWWLVETLVDSQTDAPTLGLSADPGSASLDLRWRWP